MLASILAPYPLSLLTLVALGTSRGVVAADESKSSSSSKASVTEAPIFLPSYDADDWAVLRGSVLSSDESAHETTYTIFCPTSPAQECDLSLEFPFVVVEGPSTVAFHGTYTSTYIVNLGCDLNGTTSASCSGYTSYKSGYSNAYHTGPTQHSWTSTYTGSEIQFGTLTLAEVPSTTDDSIANTATVETTSSMDISAMMYPTGTDSADGEGAGASLRGDLRLAGFAVASSVIAGCLLT